MSGRRLVALFASVALLAALVPGAAIAGQPDWEGRDAGQAAATNGVYIVQMADPPVVAYAGGVRGYKATKPAVGRKINPLATDVVRYASLLKSRHGRALGAVGGKKLYDYVYSFNGFAAKLTSTQAAKLARRAGIVAVTPDQLHEADTSSTPSFLGLDAPGGLWSMLGGPGKAGEGIIIGVVDTGIWPESLSFSDRVDASGAPSSSPTAKRVFQQIPGWHGKCVPGEAFVATKCNQKLIGARYFNAAWGGNAGIDAQRPWEFNSARDYNGHGTHTSSTAGGNRGVAATGPAAVFGKISGMAPRARVAMYKALWSLEDGSQASGYTSDLVAATDRAVADGVDVINYSISGTQTNFRDPVQIAFLYAASAGVFVATSAGNSGPTTSTVAHPSPWVTTVAAGTHNRDGQGSVTLGNGVTYAGASVATAVGPAPLIDAEAAGLAGADATAVRLCYAAVDNGGTAVLDPAKVAGKIVVCDRGITARVNKSLAVQQAGGIGMILVNTSVSSLNADFHFVPTVHLQDTDRAAVKAYAATAGATATINASTIVYDAPAPFTASFSSRGPLRASGDLLKPDLIAPGQDILAAVAPPGNAGRSFNLYSGTSMSSPHVAGLAALLKDLHPGWSPMMIKSALMTSAYDILDGPNTHPLVIFRQGAGHVQPNKAADPGLIFNSGWSDWLGFLCGTQLPTSFCTGAGIPVLDPSDFNSPSIAIAELAGSQTVNRTVINVGSTPATYTASVAGLAGITVVVDPATITLNPGQSATFHVTFTTAGASLNAYVGGYLTWADGTHIVRSPVVIRPVALAAPAQVSGTGDPISYPVGFGYDGPFTATARGLVPATTFDGSVMTDPDGNFAPVVGPDAVSYDVVVPADSTYARFSLFDAHVAPAGDLDLYVYRGATLVGSSGGGTSAEEVSLLNPAAGTYTVWVHGFATGNPSTFTLFTWVLGIADAGNMTVTAPAAAVLGQTDTITLAFSGLAAATKYLGSVAYGGAAGMPSPTIVRVDTP